MRKTTLLVVAVIWWVTPAADSDVTDIIARRQNGTKTTGGMHQNDDVSVSSVTARQKNVRVRQCSQPVSSVEMCRHAVRYNFTGWPNLVGDESLVDAERQLRTFSPLVQYGCAKRHLLFFLCAVYVPMCTEKVFDVIGPCRPVCEHARQRCEPLLQSFGFSWPSALNCTRFPAHNDDTQMCMEGPPIDDDDDDKGDVTKHSSAPRTFKVIVQFNSNSEETAISDEAGKRSSTTLTECLLAYNETMCRAPCVWITTRDRVVSVWTLVTATVCLASTLFCMATFFVDTRRFSCCERVIILMGCCSAVYAVTLLVDVVLSPPSLFCRSEHLIGPPSDHCIMVFVVLYYYTLSSATWWVVLNVVLLLTSGLGWSDGEVRRRLTTWFHVVAWSVPAVLLVAVLVYKDIELDVLSGRCHVTHGTVSQLTLVIAPLIVCLVLGITLCSVSLICSRLRLTETQPNHIKKSSKSSSEVARVRAGVVSMVGGTALACFSASTIYEMVERRYNADDDAAAAVIRVICPLMTGVVTAPWMMLSGRASAPWRTLCRRQLGVRCHQPASQRVTDVTRHRRAQQSCQLLPGHVTNTAQCPGVIASQRRHELQNCYYQLQQQQRQQYSTCRDLYTASHAHHHHRYYHHTVCHSSKQCYIT